MAGSVTINYENGNPVTTQEISDEAANQVRVDFNPSANHAVNKIKLLGAALITAITEAQPPCRESSHAKTQIEDGVMWGVKAATKN